MKIVGIHTSGVAGALVLIAALAGCAPIGPDTVPVDRLDYNEAVRQSRDEEMLLNIVRIRYLEVPSFLNVSSIIASYAFSGDLGIAGTRGFGAAPDLLGATGRVGYMERPTISYTPIVGPEFAKYLLRPVPVDILFALGQAGWPTDIVLTTSLQRINDVENMGFGQVPAPGAIDLERQFAIERDKLLRFERLLAVMLQLEARKAVEVLRTGEPPDELRELCFATNLDAETRVLAEELKAELGLEPGQNRFAITDRLATRSPGEITIKTRSILSMISFLSRGVEVPAEDLEAGRVIAIPPRVAAEVLPRIPMQIRSSESPPHHPHVAVKHGRHWFYIDGSDIRSKRTLATLIVLFQLQAPVRDAQGPLLTLPTGG